MTPEAIATYLQSVRAFGNAALPPCTTLTDHLRPIPAQKVGVAHLLLRPRFLLADPTGSGKTPMALEGFARIRARDPALRLLVVTKQAAQFQWQAAASRFLAGVDAHVLGYTAKKDKLGPKARMGHYSRADAIWITTYQTLAKDEQAILAALTHFGLVLDEAHRVQNWKQGVLWPACQRVAAKASLVWALSATPMSNARLDELFSIFELIRPGTFSSGAIGMGPHRDIADRYRYFRRRYFVLTLERPFWKDKKTGQRARPFYKVTGYQNQAHLRATIDPFYLRRPVEAFTDALPALTFRIEDVWLEPAQQRLYHEVWAARWPGAKTRLHQLAALTAAQQALGAPELLDAPTCPNAKQAAVLDLLQGELRDTKTIVYTKFVRVVEALELALTKAGIRRVAITGELTAKARDAAQQAFLTDPDLPVILITDAGGEALDLQTAAALVFYDLPWSDGAFKQVYGRARRMGSAHRNLLAILLAAPGTIDELFLTTLLRKEQGIRDVIRQGNLPDDPSLAAVLDGLEADEVFAP